MNWSHEVNRIAVAVIAPALLAAPGLVVAEASNGAHATMPSGNQERYDGQASQGRAAQDHRTREHGPNATHRHRIAGIIYVPAYGVPYYYAQSAPSYVDQDPPDDAYREPSGFYYWCPNPSGYYPDQPDCPTGWRLVVP